MPWVNNQTGVYHRKNTCGPWDEYVDGHVFTPDGFEPCGRCRPDEIAYPIRGPV